MTQRSTEERLDSISQQLATWAILVPDRVDEVMEDFNRRFWDAARGPGVPLAILLTRWEMEGGRGEIFLRCWESTLDDHRRILELNADFMDMENGEDEEQDGE